MAGGVITVHTFLFREGTWIATGSYYDAEGRETAVAGRSVIRHDAGVWELKGEMTIPGNPPVTIMNDYEIKPFAGEVTSWRSHNPGLGTLVGKFGVVDDAIISFYVSEDGEYSGAETLTRLDDRTYVGKGFACVGSDKLSSWRVELRLEE